MITFKSDIYSQNGSMLLEALIAILIFSMGILAIVGLQGASVRATTDAKNRVEASFQANQVIGKMWVDQANLSSYVISDDPVSELPDGKRSIAVNGNQVTVTVTWQMPGESVPHNFVEIVQIKSND